MLILYFCYVVRYGTACATNQWGVWAHLFIPVNNFCSWWRRKSALYSPQEEKKGFYGLNVLEIIRRQPLGSENWLKLWVCLFWCVFSSDNHNNSPVSGRGSVLIGAGSFTRELRWWDVQPLLPKREPSLELGHFPWKADALLPRPEFHKGQQHLRCLFPVWKARVVVMPLWCLLRLIWL